ncbi:MAG: c-type cytochrome [Solirubrobacterales bacterium]|nr:c-type cytochrome [Solirubrobacterales bacterium]
MIATASFVLAFLVIGATVVFLALGGGPKGARENLHRQGRGGSRFAVAGTLLIAIAFGAGIPIAVIAANQDNQSKQAPGGVNLTASQQEGRKVFAKNCSTCHTLKSANAVGRVGPNLDVIRPVAGLTLDAIKAGRARGTGQMPAGLVDGQDARDVASYVAATAGHN